MALAFDYWNQIIDIMEPQTDVFIQDILNSVREAEYKLEGMGYNKIANASGKESLGGGVAVGITMELLENWQLRFWYDPSGYTAKISGGNLVGGPSDDPIAYTAGVQVLLIQSAASTIVTVSSGGGSLPSGTNQVDLTVKKADGAPIPNAFITIRDEDGLDDLWAFKVGTNGKRTFTLDAGTYKFYPFKVGYMFDTIPQTVVVDGDETVIVEGSAVTIDPPVLPGSCRIYEYCIDQTGGGVLPSVTARARIMEHAFDDGEGKFATEVVDGLYDSSGYVYWDIVPGALVWFEIEELSVNTRVRVPTSSAGQEIRLGDLTAEDE